MLFTSTREHRSWPRGVLPGVGLLGIVVVEVLFFGFGEETGWRGFAWPRLRRRHGLLAAAAILTAPWALWHLPNALFDRLLAGRPEELSRSSAPWRIRTAAA